MTAKVGSRKLKTGRFVFGFSSFYLLTFALLLCSAFLLAGCYDPRADEAAVEQARSLPPNARKAELLNLLERRFENPDAHFELGQVYQAEGLWAKAEYHYNMALTFDPALAEAKVAMVKLFLDSGDSAKSKTYADIHMNQVAASAIQSLRLAMAFQKHQLDGYALDCYQQALNLAPGSAKVNKGMGFYYLAKGDKVQAKEYLVRSFELDANQPDVAGELGRLGVEVKIPEAEAPQENSRELGRAPEQ
ncbi:MAG: tetratricopeptide repeat protein [Planctomycetota bacterium]|jgi:lipoprotein NlpI